MRLEDLINIEVPKIDLSEEQVLARVLGYIVLNTKYGRTYKGIYLSERGLGHFFTIEKPEIGDFLIKGAFIGKNNILELSRESVFEKTHIDEETINEWKRVALKQPFITGIKEEFFYNEIENRKESRYVALRVLKIIETERNICESCGILLPSDKDFCECGGRAITVPTLKCITIDKFEHLGYWTVVDYRFDIPSLKYPTLILGHVLPRFINETRSHGGKEYKYTHDILAPGLFVELDKIH